MARTLKRTELSTADAFRLLQAELRTKQCDTVPEGWKTAGQIAEELGCSYEYAIRTLNKMSKASLCQVAQFRASKNGPRLVNHYLLSKESK